MHGQKWKDVENIYVDLTYVTTCKSYVVECVTKQKQENYDNSQILSVRGMKEDKSQ